MSRLLCHSTSSGVRTLVECDGVQVVALSIGLLCRHDITLWLTDREHLGYVGNPRSLMEGTETLCPHATILNHCWLPGTRSRLLSGNLMSGCTCRPFIPVCTWLRYAKSNSQYSLAFSLKVRDDWGFQVNPLCRHDITSPFLPSGNEG